MAKIPGLKLSLDNVSQTVNLEKLTGFSFNGRDDLIQAIAQKAIDKIVERTESGKDVHGGKLKAPYSESYAESVLFKAAGKSKTKVNMELSGQMMGTLDVLETSDSSFTIGWSDDIEIAKAFNHNTGDTVPKREFFGITDDEIKDIVSEFSGQLDQTATDDNQEKVQTLSSMFGDLLEDIDG